MFDDLTTLRAKTQYYLKKKVPVVENAWTIDGRIHCTKKRPPGLSERVSPRRIFTIDTPGDLFKLAVDSVDFEELGVAGLFCIKKSHGGVTQAITFHERPYQKL